jgi:hypothetical protein
MGSAHVLADVNQQLSRSPLKTKNAILNKIQMIYISFFFLKKKKKQFEEAKKKKSIFKSQVRRCVIKNAKF